MKDGCRNFELTWVLQHATGTCPVLLGVYRAYKAEIYGDDNVVLLSG